MPFVLMMWMIWSLLVLILAALYIYRSNLTKNEEDQIFLDDSFEHEKAEQALIAAKVTKVEPMVRMARWIVIVATGFVIVYYVWSILHFELHIF
jgi:hypothetical protein